MGIVSFWKAKESVLAFLPTEALGLKSPSLSASVGVLAIESQINSVCCSVAMNSSIISSTCSTVTAWTYMNFSGSVSIPALRINSGSIALSESK